jgi:hypothetical protein
VKHFEVPSLEGVRPTSKVLTLMTPEPTGGVYVTGFDEFMRRWGYADMSGREGREGRRNFGGVYRSGGEFHETTKLKLIVEGFDARSRKVTASGCLALVDQHGTHAAEWSFAHLLEKWSRKHARAVYVPGEKSEEPHRRYRYGAVVSVGRGTDFTLLLDAVAKGAVYLDPAVKVVASDGTKKKRNQFRVKVGDLAALYREFSQVDVTRVAAT